MNEWSKFIFWALGNTVFFFHQNNTWPNILKQTSLIESFSCRSWKKNKKKSNQYSLYVLSRLSNCATRPTRWSCFRKPLSCIPAYNLRTKPQAKAASCRPQTKKISKQIWLHAKTCTLVAFLSLKTKTKEETSTFIWTARKNTLNISQRIVCWIGAATHRLTEDNISPLLEAEALR